MTKQAPPTVDPAIALGVWLFDAARALRRRVAGWRHVEYDVVDDTAALVVLDQWIRERR